MGLAESLTGADFLCLLPQFLFLAVVDFRMGDRIANLCVNVKPTVQSAEFPHFEKDFLDA